MFLYSGKRKFKSYNLTNFYLLKSKLKAISVSAFAGFSKLCLVTLFSKEICNTLDKKKQDKFSKPKLGWGWAKLLLNEVLESSSSEFVPVVL